MDQNSSQETKVANITFFTRFKYKIYKVFAILFIVALAYGIGWKMGNKGFAFEPKSFEVINQKDQPVDVDYKLLWNAIDILNRRYIDKPLDQKKILYGAIKGAAEALGDPYTSFFPPKALSNFKTQLAGNFSGIGAEVGMKDGVVVIVAPLSESPAEKAGIKAGDAIVAVDGESSIGFTVEQAVEKIRGKKGTPVKLTLVRQGKDKAFDITIVRDTIVIKSVKWEYKDVEVSGQKQKVVVIKVNEFGDDTNKLFTDAVNDALKNGVKGVIVDMRNNPGGYLSSAVNLASNWVSSGDLIVSEAHSDGSKVDYKGLGNPRLSGIKTIVLINGGSASAAEIFSGALRDHKLAQLIGEKSFGKGSVQELDNLKSANDESEGAIKVTIAKWITPNGVNLNHNGLDPDIELKLTEENTKDGQDPQMAKALEEMVK
jgi:carboxyl-terminal processing protease